MGKEAPYLKFPHCARPSARSFPSVILLLLASFYKIEVMGSERREWPKATQLQSDKVRPDSNLLPGLIVHCPLLNHPYEEKDGTLQ